MARTISVYTHRMVSSLSGQSVGWCGQASQVASWVSHSAGIEKPSEAGLTAVAFKRAIYVEHKCPLEICLFRPACSKVVDQRNHGQDSEASPPLPRRPVRNAGMAQEEALPGSSQIPLRPAHPSQE